MMHMAVRTLVRRSFSNIERGDIDSAMAPFAEDFMFTFPGRHSFAAHRIGKPEFRHWLSRLASLHPKFVIGDVVVSGPLWNQRIVFRLSDEIRTPDGFVYR